MFHLYFGESIPNLTDWIQAVCAIFVLGLTGVMTLFARRALHTWKEEEKHRTEIELMRFLKGSVKLIVDLRNRHSGIVSGPDRQKIEEYDGQFQHLLKRSLVLKEKLRTKEPEINKVGAITILAISQLDEQNPLRVYYQYIDNLIEQIDREAKNYKFLVESMDDARNEFVDSGKRLERLNVMDDHSFAISRFADQHITLTDAIKEISTDHDLKKETWTTIYKNVKNAEETLFRRRIATDKDDGIHETLTLYYENAKKYCEQYSNPKRRL